MRDDFTKQTISEIARGVGYRCSNPDCDRPTVGANAAQDGTITIGVAAHICAASPGGPRYDPDQTPEARRHTRNGLWLCQSCGRLIDIDPEKFTIEVLAEWKRSAQNRAFRNLVASGTPISGGEETARVNAMIAADNASIVDAGFDAVFAKVHAAASADLTAYKRTPIWSNSSVELTLSLYDDPAQPSFSIKNLPLAVEIAPEVTIVAPPGTGKTTTLLQLAENVLTANSILPLYFRLGDWAAGSSRLLASLHERSAFKDISPNDVLALAARGRLLLLLDGWNELDITMRTKLWAEVKQIRRDHSSLRIVATTRRQMLDIPLSGPRVAIDPLSEEQEMAIAHAQLGSAGAKIVDDAWRTAGVRELISIPLYLSALLASGSKGRSPTSKEDVLRLFVEQHERATEHAEALHASLLGCHANILTALASHLNTVGSTVMTEAEARRIIATTVAQLRQDGQIVGQLEPLRVLEALTSYHTLMLSPGANRTIGFQHQQFQEWYASHEVAQLMRASSKGDTSACLRLRAAVLDQQAWEESVLFAVERESRVGDGVSVVAHAVRLALTIDPMLAAEMIYRASPSVWEIVKAEIISFVERWHCPGTVDRAVRFMIITGRPEFGQRIWPLASSKNSQVQLPALRTAPRFRPSVLGPDLRSKIAALSEETRKSLLTLIASESGVDGMELATELAKVDPSPKVQAEVVEHLLFRRADRHVANLLAKAHDETWALIAERSYANEIRDPSIAGRLRTEVEKILVASTHPGQRLGLLLRQSSSNPERDAGIAAAIADPQFPVRNQQGGTSIYLAQQHAPAAVLQGLRRRLEDGLELPFHASDLLKQMEVTDEGPVPTSILDIASDSRDVNAAAVMAGPNTVAALIDKYLECVSALKGDRGNRAVNELYHRLQKRIAATRAPFFLAAVTSRAHADDPDIIGSLAALISAHGDADGRKLPIPVDPDIKPRLIQILRSWVEIVISSSGSQRYHLNDVSRAIGRVGLRELVPELKRLLDEDLARLKKARNEFAEAQRRGDIRAISDARTLYGNQYRAAFSDVGGDEAAAVAAGYLEDRIFGTEAALILKAISDKQLNLPERGFHQHWPWLDEVANARASRTSPAMREPANGLAAPIFAAIDRLANHDNDKEGQLLAIRLARIALSMPHTDQDTLVARVITLPQPLNAKRELLAAMAMDGFLIDVTIVMQGIDEWLEEAAAAPQNGWHKKQETWEIEPWLELLPFTTLPEAVIEGLTKVKAFYGTGWAKRWERVLNAVAVSPGPGGIALLAMLARAHKDIAGDFEWMKAILRRDSTAAVLLYVDLFIEGVLGRGDHAVDGWHAGRELFAYVKKFPELRAELKRRYEVVSTGPGRSMLEHFFEELGDEDDLAAMIKKYVTAGQVYDGRMAGVVRAVALWHEPEREGSNSFYIHPASVARVRKSLFSKLGDTPEGRLAKSCLLEIDALRDEYGIAANDARHPDVLSELPWPLEAGQR